MRTLSDVLQRTPPEIWLTIFEQATFVPHAFETDGGDPFDIPARPHPSMIRDDDSLQSLDNALGWHSTASRKLRVRRLDLFRWPYSDDYAPLAPDTLIHLFRQLPHLEILYVATYRIHTDANGCDLTRYLHSDEVDSLIDALLATPACTTLRKCVFGPSTISARQCNNLLSRCMQLSCMFVHSYALLHSCEEQRIPPLSPLTCMSIECSDMDMADEAWNQKLLVPSLRHVHIRLLMLADGHGAGTVAFLRVQGVCLRTVQIDMCGYTSRHRLQFCLRLLAEHCPNLVHLIFIYYHRSTVLPFEFTFFPPTVTHLGVYIQDGMYSQDDHGPRRGLCAYLGHLHAAFEHQDTMPGAVPRLGVIRRLNTSTKEEWDYLLRDGELLARYAALPMPPHCRLEDAEGRDLMSLLRSSMSS
ncbi:hypothetical protein EVG20_g10516 [Dentipellis fragilis]|uniref:F-box domain-containing protein n=1 Tax=Dentipellis fragilis TaxID=205917 RepID=A0A4Y9XT01_9AGAM|nr:hypothetical protein EVG20_g10516 [Dentipellis fragilis]